MKEALYCKNNLEEPVPYKDLCLKHKLRAMDNPTNQAVVGIVVVIVIIVLAVVALRIFKWHLLTKQFFSKYKPANPATTVFKYDNFLIMWQVFQKHFFFRRPEIVSINDTLEVAKVQNVAKKHKEMRPDVILDVHTIEKVYEGLAIIP